MNCPQYEEITEAIRNAPATWLPAIVGCALETAYDKDVFAGMWGIQEFSKKILESKVMSRLAKEARE